MPCRLGAKKLSDALSARSDRNGAMGCRLTNNDALSVRTYFRPLEWPIHPTYSAYSANRSAVLHLRTVHVKCFVSTFAAVYE
jgi:hypothetical protein